MPYKILSLDGGGAWAMIQARVLLDIYGDIRGHELLRKFDLAIANSGGSLVLACLCSDMKMSETIAIFNTESSREKVFSKLNFWEKIHEIIAFFSKYGIGPKYSTQRKLTGLIEVIKQHDHLLAEGKVTKPIIETQLNELPEIIGKKELQLLIVGFDYFKERVGFFRSNTNSLTDQFNPSKHFSVSLAHAIHSSSNAPVNYFDHPGEVTMTLINKQNETRTSWYWDGAVSGFNNPVLAGLIEAKTNNPELPHEDYCILSLGTGTGSPIVLTDYKNSSDPQVRNIYEKNKNNKLTNTEISFSPFHDIQKMATSILSDPPDSATFIAYSILDPGFKKDVNLVRISPCLNPLRNDEDIYVAPSVYKDAQEAFERLLHMDMDAVEQEDVNLIAGLCDKFITQSENCLPNQLIRGDKETQHLGQYTYKEAKQKWMKCM